MRGILLLAWRYVVHQRGRSLILAASVALVALLPIAVNLLVRTHGEALLARARSTPLVAGAKGSRYDLVLNALYFEGRVPDLTNLREVEEVERDGLARAIPLLARRTARGRPLVGVPVDYFEFRGLAPASGTLPLFLGECVLGSAAASQIGAGPGDKVLTDTENVYDLTLAHPLVLRVAGVLRESGTADDGAVFVDLKTAWIVEGIGHGHGGADTRPENEVIARSPEGVTLAPSVFEHTEITPENAGTFHFHGPAEGFPLTALIVLPRDARAATQLKGRYRVSPTGQVLVPEEVVVEILGFVLKVKRFFDANVLLVTVATGMFLVLIVLLTLRVRAREIETLARLGCARGTVAALLATELVITLGAGLLAGAAAAFLLLRFITP